jgi:hypothetical protein
MDNQHMEYDEYQRLKLRIKRSYANSPHRKKLFMTLLEMHVDEDELEDQHHRRPRDDDPPQEQPPGALRER